MPLPDTFRSARGDARPARRHGQLIPKLARGFTLIELVVTMAIGAVLMAIGVPSFQYVLNSTRVSREMNSLVVSLQYARAEAIKRGQHVILCSATINSAASAAAPSCSGSSSWINGWFIFVDTDNSGTYSSTTDGAPLQVQAAWPIGNSGLYDSFVSDSTSNATQFIFDREGFVTGQTGAVILTLKPHNAGTSQAWTRCLQVAKIGQLTQLKNSTSPTLCQ